MKENLKECPKGHPYDSDNTFLDSKGHRRCRECNRIQSRIWGRKRYEEIRACIIEAKNVPCADCSIQYPPYVMHFDHRDPKLKEFTISHAGRFKANIERLKKEIEKCDVVCANCHALRHGGCFV